MKKKRKSSKEIFLDDIDINIIEELCKNPRENLRKISQILKKKNVLASPETVRKRIRNLFKYIYFQPFIETKAYGLEVAALLIKVKGSVDSRKKIIEKVSSLGGYNVAESIGSYDVMAYIAIQNASELSVLVDSLKSMQEVEDVNHIIITRHHSSLSQLLEKLKKK